MEFLSPASGQESLTDFCRALTHKFVRSFVVRAQARGLSSVGGRQTIPSACFWAGGVQRMGRLRRGRRSSIYNIRESVACPRRVDWLPALAWTNGGSHEDGQEGCARHH